MADRVYAADEWPHGLTCMDCGRPFVEDQPISERLTGMGEYAFEPMAVVELVCVACNLGATA